MPKYRVSVYSPRRRGIAYVISQNLLRQNGTKEEKGSDEFVWRGPYRRRYDDAKANAIAKHPGWSVCRLCGGKDKKCETCGGKPLRKRYQRHAMLLMGKLLLKNLWLEWWGDEVPTQPWKS